MTVEFPYREERLRAGKTIFRPVAKLQLRKGDEWISHYFYVVSGADYTLVPYRIGRFLGLGDTASDVSEIKGIGGVIGVRFADMDIRVGDLEFRCPVAWAQVETLPLLLGRQGVFDRFTVTFRQKDLRVVFRLE